MTFAAQAQPSTYFDTPAQDLRKAGVSLRIRRIGTRRIQTVKAGGAAAAGLFARPEWERDVVGDLPLLDAAAGPLTTLVPEAVLARVVPAFIVDVTRRTGVLRTDAAEIEIVLDAGRVLAGERRTAIAEIELELRRGAPQSLFALARTLDDAVPLRIGVTTKSERGYRLLDGARETAVKAAPATLAAGMSPAAALKAIAVACLRQYRLNEALFLRARTVESLHQMRVALRRLRSALSIFRAVAQDDAFGRLRDELRWLTDVLGAARDLDVLIARLGDAAPEPLHAARKDACATLRTALDSPRARRLMIDLLEWITIGTWADASVTADGARTVEHFAADALERLRRRLKRRGRKLGKLDDAERHEVRILAKKLRYAADYFGQLFAGRKAQRRHAAFRAALAALQEQLGDLNDLATAPGIAARFGIPIPDVAAPARRREALLARAQDAYEALVDTKRFW